MEALHPFELQPWLAGTELKAACQWLNGRLEVSFALQTPAETVLRPQPCGQIERRDELWQSTCFEAFFAEAGQEHYWEINLAPNGHWNVYRLDGYRRGLRPEPLVSGFTYALRQSATDLQLSFSLNLQPLIAESSGLECSLTAVLDHPKQGCSFWALNHSSDQADFHRRKSFRALRASQG